MKKLFSVVLTAVIIMSTALPVSAVRGYRSLWIECENAYTSISGDFRSSADGNASGRASLTLDSTNNEIVHEAAVNFTLSYDNTYDIFICGTPGTSDWASKHTWSLDGAEPEADTGTIICNAYTTGTSRGAGISWHKLTTTALEKGTHSLNFKVNAYRSMGGFCYTVFDVIAVVPSEWEWQPNASMMHPYDKNKISMQYVEGNVKETTAKTGDTIHINVKNRIAKRTDANLNVFARLSYNGETVVSDVKAPSTPTSSWIQGKAYGTDFQVTVPFNAPNGIYEVLAGIEGIDYAGENPTEVVGTITIGTAENNEIVPYKADITDVSAPETIVKGENINVSFNADIENVLPDDSKVYIGLWKDDLLYSVMETSETVNESGHVEVTAKCTDDLPEGEYILEPGIHNYATEAEKITVKVSGTNSGRSIYHKPMSYGRYYAKKNGKTHFWYIDQTGTNIFGGEAYIPMGGMFVSKYITNYSETNDEANIKNFEQDKADLELLRNAGVKDLYINPVGGTRPVWAWQYLLDYLDDTGWRYGIQQGIVSSRAADMYYPKATEKSGWIKIENVTKNGKVDIEQKIITGAVYDYQNSLYVAINDETGKVTDSGTGTAKATENGVTFTADIKNIKNAENHTVYFAPRVNGSLSQAVNFWDYEEQVLKNTENFFSKFKCGSGLRLVVDPMGNETGIYNASEITRFTGDVFDGEYAKWLEEKYTTTENLNAAWKTETPIESFEIASQMIPVLTTNPNETNNYYSYYVDYKSGNCVKTNSRNGTAWNDYLDGRDDLYLAAMNRQADTIKQYMDLPVVHKHCSIQRRYYINKQTKGGLDALGAEAYGSLETSRQKAAMAVAQTKQFARTAWVVTTETNNNENVMGKYESGQWGYESAEVMEKHFDAHFNAGIKGIYDFLLADRVDLGGKLGMAYSHVTNPENLAGLSQYIKKTETAEFRAKITQNTYPEETYYFYPSQKNWWYSANERSVVQLEDDNARIQRLSTQNGNIIAQTDDPSVDTRILFVNLNDGPYSNIFGPKLMEEIQKENTNKKFVFMGLRNDIGTLETDKYYSDKTVTLSDGTVIQPLLPDENCEILAKTEGGDVWAMKCGNLYFMATNDLFDISGEQYVLKHTDVLGVTK